MIALELAVDWLLSALACSQPHEMQPVLLNLLAPLQAPTEEGCDVLATERGYFRNNADRMHYPAYREQGLPIGSGAVESAAKHLVQQRMKRAGMRWGDLGARAILHLRCALLEGTLLAKAA